MVHLPPAQHSATVMVPSTPLMPFGNPVKNIGNLPIIQYDEHGVEKVVGIAQSIRWNPHGFIEVDGLLLFGGTNETVEFGKDDCVVSMELSAVGIG